MKLASKILNIVGIVLNGAAIVSTLVKLFQAQNSAQGAYNTILEILYKIAPESANNVSYNAILALVIGGLITILAMEIVAVVLGSVALNKTVHGSIENTPHVMTIVAGGLTLSPVYIVSGILGIVANKQQQNP